MVKEKTLILPFFLIAFGLLIWGCVDPFEPETVSFESALVVEATITDELKQQEILLSRTFEFEEDGPDLESGAQVRVTDDTGGNFVFVEASPGRYISSIPFQAVTGRSYTLRIETRDGRSYSSLVSQIAASLPIENVYAERIVNGNGEEGVAIFIDSFDPTGNSRNYRYLYEETYQIIAPLWNNTAMIPSGMGCGIDLTTREQDERVCYNTEVSKNLIFTDTNGFEEDRVSRFMVRFINRNNFIISHRYSILVKQLIQSDAAFSYFETLQEFSGSESLFTDTQVGFLNGNVFSDLDSNEKVLGYFDVASVSELRIFFNYEDLFPNEPLPPYVNPCIESAPPLVTPQGECFLLNLVLANSIRYVADNSTGAVGPGPYLVVNRVCGDCTAIGKLEVPEFWTEE